MSFDAFHNAERAGWHARADGYGQATGLATLQIVPAMLDSVSLRAGQRLLDLATGPGYVAGAAAALDVEATGIDFADAMIAVAKARYPRAAFQVADVQDVPFEDDVFDAVTCNIGLFHVTDPDRALAEAARVLRPGGVFAFSQWAAPSASELYAKLFEVLKAHADLSLADPAPDAYRLSDPAIVEEMMQSVGFTAVTTRELPTVLIATSDDFFDFFMRFGVRVPLIVAAQSASARSAIKDTMNAAMARYKTPTGFEVPMPSLLYSGRLQ